MLAPTRTLSAVEGHGEDAEGATEANVPTWWDWVWREEPDSYCGAMSELTLAEHEELLAVGGMIPLWLSARGPSDESRWYRCPLTPDHNGPHATFIGSLSSDFRESAWVEVGDRGYYISDWYLLWGTGSGALRSIQAVPRCFGEHPDAEGTLWQCGLMADHSGSCRATVRAAVEDDEEY